MFSILESTPFQYNFIKFSPWPQKCVYPSPLYTRFLNIILSHYLPVSEKVVCDSIDIRSKSDKEVDEVSAVEGVADVDEVGLNSSSEKFELKQIILDLMDVSKRF